MPTHEALIYKVFPDGYNSSDAINHDSWCVYVEKRLQPDYETYKWLVSTAPGQRSFVFTRTGKRIYDTPLQRRWTRFDTLQEALELAYNVVNTNGPFGMTIERMNEHWEKRRKERDATDTGSATD